MLITSCIICKFINSGKKLSKDELQQYNEMHGEEVVNHYIIKETGAYVASKSGVLIPKRGSDFYKIHFKMKEEFVKKVEPFIYKYICERCLYGFIKNKQCDNITYDNDGDEDTDFINLLSNNI